MPISVLIYDDNEHLRNSIKTLLQWDNDFEVAATIPDVSTVVEDIKELKPDIIVMDIDMPPYNGVSAVKQIREAKMDVPVIMLTVFEDNDNILNAICAGANGYLLKNDIAHLAESLKEVLNGGAPMTSIIARKAIQLLAQNTPRKIDLPPEVTKREWEILNELVKGNSHKMIALQLQISIDTVRTHLKNIYKKLQVNGATEAVYKITR